MRVLFDVCHPAHVHLFKHAIAELEATGHEVLVTSREKEVTLDLLDAYGIDHEVLSTQGEGGLALALEWVKREFRLLRRARRFDPDVIVSHINIAAAHASAVLGCPNLVFNDNEEAARMAGPLVHPFTTEVATPASFSENLGDVQNVYRGFHELAYLHPDRFEPDPERLRRHGVDPEDPYSVVRLVSWGAYHDAGKEGLTAEGRQQLVSTLAEHGDVYITSEEPLPAEFDDYRLPVPPEAIHDLLAHANLYVGDSHTMAIEAGLLATPAVRFNFLVDDGDLGGYDVLGDEYGLVRSTADVEEGLALVAELAADPDAGERWEERRRRLVDETIDVTDFLLDRVHALAGRTRRPVADEPTGEEPAGARHLAGDGGSA